MREPRRISRAINGLADFLSTSTGFLATSFALLAGIGIGALVQFNEGFMFGFNIFLSVAAIVIAGVILVAGARSEAALHVKLDYLIEYSKATNKVIGIEHRDADEIEKERKAVEQEAAEALGEMVEEEVTEQLGRRKRESA
jgi:low affinity Fe/Cu permease